MTSTVDSCSNVVGGGIGIIVTLTVVSCSLVVAIMVVSNVAGGGIVCLVVDIQVASIGVGSGDMS